MACTGRARLSPVSPANIRRHSANDPAGYKQLQRVLHTWSLAVVATNKPGYYEALEDAKSGVGEYVAWEDVVAKFDSTR
jgi:hypothetical protein